MQIDLFHLRERDLLKRFAEEVSEHQSQGNSKESAFILVRTLPPFDNYSFIIITILQFEATIFTRVINLPRTWAELSLNEQY
jgi:hypothetical protein